MNLLAPLDAYLQQLGPELAGIAPERRERLAELAAFVRERGGAGQPAELTFICTHNSRRSHMAQLWAAAVAASLGLDHVRTYSGGTEATAFNPRAVAALRRAGFEIDAPDGDNPRYQVVFSENAPALTCFSKVYDHPDNPRAGFAAVMTCSDADEACPAVPGAALRVAVPWTDPKASDGSPAEAATYDARCRQIAVEMLALFSAV